MYDVVIIGSGPSGIFAALELLKNNKDTKILMLDEGRSIKVRSCPKSKTGKCMGCKPCNISSGFGGAGAFSDGKLSLSKDVGGWLGKYIGEDKLEELIDYVDKIYLEYGGNPNISYNKEFAEKTEYECSKYGLKFVKCPVRHLGTEKSQEVMERLYDHIISHKNTKVEDLSKVEDIIIDKDILVKIRDTGKGIDKKEIPYIWDKYYKNKKKHKRNLVGTGLGLSIVKKILDQHHFSYGVESIKNQGTTFYFSITK